MALSRHRLLSGHERDLISRSVSGDAAAADALLDRYKDDVYNIVRRMVDDRETVEDIVVEVLAEAYQSLGTFKGRSAFRTWLYRITVRICLQHVRRGRPPEHPTPPDEAADPHGDVAQIVVRKAQAEAIERAIHSLSETLRPAVSLYYLSHCSCGEIAQILRVPKGTVQRRIFDGTRLIRQALRESGEI
jgi:RNA polymerase sigma-70 factor (ECF subfamily)